MKVKSVPSKKMPSKKPLGAIQKKKFSKPTGGVLKNIVKITDAFEDMKSGNDLTGISCSKEAKPLKKSVVKETIKSNDKEPKNKVDMRKRGAKKPVVEPKQKKPKKDKIDGEPKISLKSKLLESNEITEVNNDDSDPKLDIKKVNLYVNY